MADLKIPNLNKKSEKYIFKKKLKLRRKSKRRLFIESAFMFFLSLFLIYINYLLTNRITLLQNLPITINASLLLVIDLISKIYEIFLVIFIIISPVIILVLILGSLYRIFRILKRKTKIISYK